MQIEHSRGVIAECDLELMPFFFVYWNTRIIIEFVLFFDSKKKERGSRSFFIGGILISNRSMTRRKIDVHIPLSFH